MIVKAPWTYEQVHAAGQWQENDRVHPYTCGKCREVLVATRAGWICPRQGCDYTQDWAHDFTLNPPEHGMS